jgi:integrase
MAIRKRGDSWQIDYLDPGGKRVRQSFSTRKEAAAELGKRVSLIAEGRYLDVKPECKTTLADLCKRYTECFGSQSNFENAKRKYLQNFKQYFGADRLLSTIAFKECEAYCNQLRQKPISAVRNGVEIVVRGSRKDSSVNREMACLHHLFNKAVEWDMMERSPFERKRSLRLKENNKRMQFLSQDEIDRLLDECPPHLKPIVRTALLTGMRRGEIISLKWDQIRNGFIYLTKTKTDEPRQIRIGNELEAILKDIRRKDGLRYEHVFTYQGEAIKHNLQTSFEAAVRRAGLINFHFHDLRHTCASQLIQRGGSLKQVQELLGHKTMTMTLRYAHLSQESMLKAVNLLDGLTSQCHKTVTLETPAVSNLPN